MRARLWLLISLAGCAAAQSSLTDNSIAMYERMANRDPDDPRYRALLAGAYIQKTRETADPNFIDRAARIVEKMLAEEPDNYEAWRLRNQIELNRHHFAKVAEYSLVLTRKSPEDPRNWGTLGDASMELGEYERAREAFERMLALNPGLFSYNRMAYYHFVTGNAAEAIGLMQKAVESASFYPENRAWCLVELGHLYFRTGKIGDAERVYREALQVFPASHTGHAGLGMALAARGEWGAAIESYQRAQEVIPLPEYAAALSDLYEQVGKKAEAKREWALLAVVEKTDQAAGQKANRKLAMAYADHDRSLARALELARAELEVRNDVYTYDELAWVLHKNGNNDEAQRAVEKALALGTPEPSFYYHAGMIALARGEAAEARKELQNALALNPKFDLRQSAIAEAALKKLR